MRSIGPEGGGWGRVLFKILFSPLAETRESSLVLAVRDFSSGSGDSSVVRFFYVGFWPFFLGHFCR